MSFIDLHTNVSLGHTKIVGLGGEKLWLCPTLGGDKLDISGNGNHGTYNGGMGTVADTSNGGTRAYSFDGVDDRVDFGDILDTEVWTSGDFAISGWVKTNGSNTVQVLNKYHNISGNRQFHFRVIYSGGNLKLNAYIHTTLNNAEYRFWEGSTNLNANTWYHVALNYDASASSNDRASCFINGSSETMTVTQSSGTLSTIPDGSASLAIGARVSGASASDFRTGYSDDIRIFDRALSTSEIKHLASKRGVLGSPRNPVIKKRRIFYAPTAPVTTTAKAVVLKKPKPSYATGYAKNASESANPNLWKGLVGAWMPSFGVTGNTLKDVSGNGNDGTLTNMNAAADWVGTQKGTALYFDNNVHKVSYQTNFQSGFQNSFTFSCLVKFNASDDRDTIFGNYNASSGWLNFERHTSNRLRHVYLNGASVVDDYSPNNSVSAGWNFVNFTRQRISSTQSRLIYHVNGKEVRNASISYVDRTVTWPNFFLGADTRNTFTNLNGNIAFASIYNRALSPTEIKQLYLNPAAPFFRKQQTVGISTAAVAPSANFNPFSVLTHPLEQ